MADSKGKMRLHSEEAWKLAHLYSDVLASETRDLAAAVDMLLDKEREELAKTAAVLGLDEFAQLIRDRKWGQRFHD